MISTTKYLGRPWQYILDKSGKIYKSEISATHSFKRKLHKTPHDNDGFIFTRNIPYIKKKNKELIKLCQSQINIYKLAGLKVNFSLTDLIELVCVAEQLGRCMRMLTELDIQIVENRFIDYRLYEEDELFLGCNIVTTFLLKCHSHSPVLHPDSLLINAILQRQAHNNFIPPLIHSLG